VYQLEVYPEGLYLFAMRLFQATGLAITSDPLFYNHTPEQIIYFDTDRDISLSQAQRRMLNNVTNISHLFNIDAEIFDSSASDSIGFYSIELMSSKKYRSQLAYDIHGLLRHAFSGAGNIVLFRHDDKVLVSVQGYDSDVYLSDWFDSEEQFDELVERIHACCMSYRSSKEFLSDFIYAAARWYYIYPITGEEAAYSMLPLFYFDEIDRGEREYDREEIKEMVRGYLRTAEVEYGDDYVEQGNMQTSSVDIGAELDLLALEMDMDDDQLPDEFIDEETGDVGAADPDDLDEYEFEDFDPDLFNDPALMVKFLEKSEKHQDEETVDLRNKDNGKPSLSEFFNSFELEVIDKRPFGGCLWVVGDSLKLGEYLDIVEEEYGVVGNFASGKATGGRIGWYTRSSK